MNIKMSSLQRTKNIIILMLLTLGCMFLGSIRVHAASNTSMSTAESIIAGKIYSGTSSSSDDERWYSFQTGTQLSSYTFEVVSPDSNAEFGVYDAMNRECGYIGYVSAQGEILTLKLNPDQTYYIRIKSRSYGYSGDYTFTYKSAADEADTFDTANLLTPGQKYEGSICVRDDKDYYYFNADYSGTYTVNVVSIDSDLSLSMDIYDSNKRELDNQHNNYISTSGYAHAFKLSAGKYYISINSYLGDSGKYNVWVTRDSIDQTPQSVSTVSQSTSKVSQSISVWGTSKKLSYKKLKKKALTFFVSASAKTPVSFAKVSGSSKIKVSSNGLVNVKKKTKKGTYKVKVSITASGSGQYNAASKIVTLVINLKQVKKIKNLSGKVLMVRSTR